MLTRETGGKMSRFFVMAVRKLSAFLLVLVFLWSLAACEEVAFGDDGGVSGGSAASGADDSNEPLESRAIPNDAADAADAQDSARPADSVSAAVKRVVDGDTLVVDLGGVEERVRLIGIDTPESVHPDASRNVPYGEVASAYTKSRLDGQSVALEFDVEERDQYGRLLAYIWIGNELFNETLVLEGHAQVSTYPPNVRYVELFTSAQNAAREAGKGVWGIEADTGSASDGNASASDGSAPASSGAAAGSSGADTGISDAEARYVGTTRSMKFHTTDCAWGQKITPNNAAYFQTRDEAIAAGFIPCKVCNP
jgi:micrococcal nuclease